MHISHYGPSLKGRPPQVLAYVTTYVQCRLRKLVLHQTEGGRKGSLQHVTVMSVKASNAI